ASGGDFEQLTPDTTAVTTTLADTLDETTVALSADKTSISEAGGEITYTATLSAASQGETLVETTLGTISIADGATTGSFVYAVAADEDVYADGSTVINGITSATGGNFELIVPNAMLVDTAV
ncbi:immunoglobulin-like domain-containing protein, partial [Moritella sp. Urea-trap-13]|uniref:immunoglobulin-like domain-containing protein n=1 Tax=Moritella sp. Urea-trap-13 TaxID=2058327 RepID=UPI000CC8EEBA